MLQDDPVIMNFQIERRMRDDLHALARRRERSASAEIRIALRNHLSQPPPSEQQQHDDLESTATP
jgi:hypothetical protein